MPSAPRAASGAGIVNQAYDKAQARRKEVKKWIEAYNQAEPKDISAITDTIVDQVSISLRQAAADYAATPPRITRDQFLATYLDLPRAPRIEAIEGAKGRARGREGSCAACWA